MTNFPRSNADNAAASDVLTRIARHPRSLPENAAGSDALTRINRVDGYSLAEGAAALDSLSPVVGRIGLSAAITFSIVPSATLQVFNLTAIAIPSHRSPNMRVVIVDRTGRPYADLPQARITRPPQKILNGIGTCEFEFPTLDPHQAEVQLLTREVQIWRNGKPFWWGVMVDATADFETVKVSCYSLEWYLFRRFFGPIVDHFLENGNFDDPVPLAHWSATNCTATKVTAPLILGPNAVKLTTPNANTDSYLSQRITITAGGAIGGEPTVYFPKAWYWLDPNGFQGPALNERGLFAILYDEGGAEVARTVHGGLISNSHGRGTWQRLELTNGLQILAGRTWTIEMRLYCPGGTIYWGAADITVEESVATPGWPGGGDVNDLISNVITYAQDSARLKSPLSFAYSGAATGKVVERAYQFFDNANIWSSLLEWPTAEVADIGITWDANGRVRTFNTWPGQRGSVKPAWPIASGRNIVGGSLNVRGSDSTTSERILSSQPTGPNRETGVSIDTSQLGGLILEQVDSVGKEIEVAGLQDIADKHVARFRSTTRIPAYTIAAEGFIDNVDVGDTVPVILNHGWLQEQDLRRIISLAWEPGEDVLTVEVNDET